MFVSEIVNKACNVSYQVELQPPHLMFTKYYNFVYQQNSRIIAVNIESTKMWCLFDCKFTEVLHDEL